MSGLSRRTLLTGGSLAVAAGAAAAVVPALGANAAQAKTPESERALSESEVRVAASAGPLVAHVSDLRTGEISFYQGETQVVVRDRSLAASIARAASHRGR